MIAGGRRDEDRAADGPRADRRAGRLARSACGGLPGRRIFLHINNTNPILLEGSPERCAVERAGFEVAYDGMEVRL